MRWFVEISSLGTNAPPLETLCVEAAQWQPALQKARALRGDDGALTNFSIELLDNGYRAIDPRSRLRYMVRKAPDDAELTGPKNGVSEGVGAAAASPSAASNGLGAPASEAASAPEAAARPKPTRAAATLMFSSDGAAEIREAVQAAIASAAAAESASAAEPASAEPTLRLVSKREEEPSAKSPLTYREHVYVVPAGTTEDVIEKLLLERLDDVRRQLEDARPGKFVNLAVFDHVFESKPLRKPVVTLAWKDWKGDALDIRYPLRGGAGNSAPPLATQSGPPPSPSAPPAAQPSEAAAAPAEKASAAAAEPSRTRAEPAPAEATPKKADAAAKPAAAKADKPAPKPVKPAPARKRLSGDDLIAELFEAFSDLHFLRDALEGAEFTLSVTLEKIPSEVGIVSLYDIDKREFVVVRQHGGEKSALLHRLPERSPIAHAAMRSRRAVVVADARTDRRPADDRWTKAIGVDLVSYVCAPVEQGGRYIGLIELANPLDGGRFTDGDGHALTYIGEQFAEFVSQRGILLDPEHVLESSSRGGGGRRR